MRQYIARTPHKRPCDLCGDPILRGHRCVTWCYVGEDGPSSSNIIRAHATCSAIRNEIEIDEWHLGQAFMCEDHQNRPEGAMQEEYDRHTDALAGHERGWCPLLVRARKALMDGEHVAEWAKAE